MITLLNNERTSRGLVPLAARAELGAAADRHSADMACNDFVNHTGSDGSTMATRIEAAGYLPWALLAENVAAGYSTPSAVVAAWMSSDDHRANILNPGLTEIGVGYAYRSGTTYGHYWTTDFGDQP